jgi:hypothetical protein
MRILSTKNFLIGSLAALSFVFAGCLTKSDDDEEPASKVPVITAHPQNVSDSVGAEISLSVTATGDSLEYTWLLDDEALNGEDDSTLEGEVYASLNGSTLKVIVSNSHGADTSNAATITVLGLTNMPTADTLTVGGNGHLTLGSAIDLDSAKVLSSTQVNANSYAALARVDLVLLYYSNSFSLNGTQTAKDSGVAHTINLTNNYPNNLAAEIKLLVVDEKPANQELAAELWADAEGTAALVGSVKIVVGTKFLVVTSAGNLVYVEVKGITGTTSAGTAKLDIVATDYGI